MAELDDFMECEEEEGNEREEVFDIDCDDEYKKFDSTIGHIEDIILGDEFQQLQDKFMEKYYHEFDDVEENKFIYSDIHKEYTSIIETYLTEKLIQLDPEFSMEEFQNEIKSMDLDCEIFEVISSFSDFLVFKDSMLQYKKSKENNYNDLCVGVVTVRSIMPKSQQIQQQEHHQQTSISNQSSKKIINPSEKSSAKLTNQHFLASLTTTTATHHTKTTTPLSTKNKKPNSTPPISVVKSYKVPPGTSDTNITSTSKNKRNIKSPSALINNQMKTTITSKNPTRISSGNLRTKPRGKLDNKSCEQTASSGGDAGKSSTASAIANQNDLSGFHIPPADLAKNFDLKNLGDDNNDDDVACDELTIDRLNLGY